ncbi:MAG TPA: EamA family transporter [Candidatus Onthocola gallistercoris]|uniref:EamA family transporter n=1 Tax=Candidatus Onthocola gallistercoris TaxID=2840876 RepID=A0A9D1HEI4_9FIRM|nr:EamA family transporter [Candidatus Onthocola gallistercoris]
MWLIYAVGSAFFAGLTSIFAKCGIRETDSTVATALRTVVILVFSWIIVGIEGSAGQMASIDDRSLLFLILSGAATGASWLCYFRALQLGDINKVVPVDKSSTVLTILLALIFLQEGLSLEKAAATLAIAAGIFLMIEKKDVQQTRSNGGNWLIYAVGSAFFASLTAILGKIGISGVDSNLGTAIRTIVVLIMAWVMVFVSGKQGEVRHIRKRELGWIGLSGIATGTSWLCYYRALQEGPASVVAPVDKLSVLVTVVFSYFVFGEKLSKRGMAGLVLLTAGTVAMAML